MMSREFAISLICVFAGVVLHGCGSSETASDVKLETPLGSVRLGAGDEQVLILAECRSLIKGGIQKKFDAVNKSLVDWCKTHTTPETTYGDLPDECFKAVDVMLGCGREELLGAYGPQCTTDTLNANKGHDVEEVTSVT